MLIFFSRNWSLNSALLLNVSIVNNLPSQNETYSNFFFLNFNRCFLTDGTCRLHDILASMFRQVFRICSAILDCTWEVNPESGRYETSYRHLGLTKAFEIFTQHQKVFLECKFKYLFPFIIPHSKTIIWY